MLYKQRKQENKKMKMLQFRESVIMYLLDSNGSSTEKRIKHGDPIEIHHLGPSSSYGKKSKATKPYRLCTKEQKRK